MTTKLLASSGCKQSGKSSLCAYIQAHLATTEHNRFVKNHHSSKDSVQLVDVFYKGFTQKPDGSIEWYSQHDRPFPSVDESELRLNDPPNNINEISRVYSFADSLKEMCVNILGMSLEQCYGTDEQKNSPTNMKWDNLPKYIRWANNSKRVMMSDHRIVKSSHEKLEKFADRTLTDEDSLDYVNSLWGNTPLLRSGFMTGREVMQVFGTDVMRRMFFPDVWVKATINKIKQENKKLALIADMRFQSEFNVLYEAGAYIIRLERQVTHDDHPSERDFDGFDWSKYDRVLVIPADATLAEKNRIAIQWLRERQIVE